MLICLLQFLLGSLDVVCCCDHVLIEADKLLSLHLHLDIDVLCDSVNVLHDGLDLADFLLSLLDHLIHVVCLGNQLKPTDDEKQRLISITLSSRKINGLPTYYSFLTSTYTAFLSISACWLY